jgi:hypothetical protein
MLLDIGHIVVGVLLLLLVAVAALSAVGRGLHSNDFGAVV